MSEEVKIVLRTEAQGDGAKKTRDDLRGVEADGKRAAEATRKVTGTDSAAPKPARPQRQPRSIAEQNQAALEAYYAKADAEKAAAEAAEKEAKKNAKTAPARRNRAAVAEAEENLTRARATGAPADVIAEREAALRERKLAARFMREQGLSEEDASAKAQGLVMLQNAAKARAAAEKTEGKTRIENERKATQEMQEQERIAKRITIRLGGMVGAGAVAIGGELLNDYFERQSIGNRDVAERSLTARKLQIQSGGRGTSSEVQAEAWAAQDQLAELKANIPEIENKARQSIWQKALTRGAQGAVGGTFVGGLPGAIVGGVGGAIIGAGEGWLEGDRAKTENRKAIARTEKKAQDAQALAIEKALKEETGLEVDAIRQRAKRSFEGQRAAQVDDFARQGMAEYRRLINAGVPKKEAADVAMAKTETDLRDRQIAASSGLVDARAGASDIAAAARWSQQAIPGADAVKELLGPKLDRLISTSEKQVDATMLQDWSQQ